MSSLTQNLEGIDLTVSNIGGIDSTEVTFEPGVTVLAGRNATNRTSLLQAIMTGLGSENVSLKSDAEEGHVELTVDGETYTRTLSRAGDGVAATGDPYLDDPELADLFAFLLESNEARRAVVRSDDLRELIMRPVDTEEIQAEIESHREERERLDARIEEIDELERELPDLKRELGSLEDDIAAKEDELSETEAEIDAIDADVEETREEKSERERKFAELRSKRSELQDLRSEIDRKERSLEDLRERREELAADETEMPDAPSGEIREIDSQIDQLRSEVQTINSTINEIQTIIQFNQDKLVDTNNEITEALGVGGGDSGAVTDRLVEDTQTVCWTCGSEVEKSAIEATLDQLKELNQQKLDRKQELQDEIDELEDEKIVYQEKQRQRDQIERELDTVERKIEDREERLEDLREEAEALAETVADLEETVEELEEEDDSEILELHKEANRLGVELDRLKSEREEVEAEIAEIEDRIDERADLAERRETIADELEDLRTRIDRIEAEAAEEFNEHMETVLSMMGFENLDRIWIERKQTTVREGRRKVDRTKFELHVVRSTEEGVSYEDRIDNLSESERETTGLIFALAGYLVHDVHEEVPFMLLDSLEAIDSDRIAKLVDYFSDYPTCLVVALLPEDAAAVESEHARISEI